IGEYILWTIYCLKSIYIMHNIKPARRTSMQKRRLATFPMMIGFITLLSLGAYASDSGTSGSSSATMTLVVPVQTTVTCSSPSVTASVGSNTLTVTCTLSGNPNSLASGTANSFGPSAVTMSDGSGHSLTANLQNTITSPDSTMTSLSGSSSGFSG